MGDKKLVQAKIKRIDLMNASITFERRKEAESEGSG
jgi:predicted RNA-binding protein